MGGPVIAAFDNSGLVYAVACSATQTISMYSTQTMDTGPFQYAGLRDPALEEISMPPPVLNYTSVAFSNNGHYLLVGTDSDAHYLLDAYDLSPIRKLVGHRPLGHISGEQVSFVSDGRFVYSGSADGAVYFWDLGPEKLSKGDTTPPGRLCPEMRASVVVKPDGDASRSPSRVVAFNPRLCMMALGGEELVSCPLGMGPKCGADLQSFWLPTKDESVLMDQGW